METSPYCPLVNHGPQTRGPYDSVRTNSSVPQVYVVPEESIPAPRRRVKRWPWFLWFLVRFTGLFNSRRAVTARHCNMCRLAILERHHRAMNEEESVQTSECNYPGGEVDEELFDEETDDVALVSVVDGNMNRSSTDISCEVCMSQWWDSHGNYCPYTENDIGVRPWNHWGSTLLSFAWSLLIIAFILFDFFYYIRDYWGKEQQLLRLISYSTYLLFTMSVPTLSLIANASNRRGRRNGLVWYKALKTRSIVKSLQLLNIDEHGLPYKPYLVLCLLWPFLTGAYRAGIYLFLVKSHEDVHINISLAAGVIAMMIFGAFCYLLLLLRLSFEKQLQVELAFLWKQVGNLDVCRRRLSIYAEELGSICQLVSIFFIFVVAISTWAFTTQISWNYLIISSNLKFHKALLINNINIMIWSENFMFLVLPLVAVGGITMNGMWVRFRRSISQMRSEAHDVFWDKVTCFCHEQTPIDKVKTLTMMFSALGLFLGLQYTDQNVEYWTKSISANSTMSPIMENYM